MLSESLIFFPSPYHDESLYGICTRFHERSGHCYSKETAIKLFGSMHTHANVDFPSRIAILCGKITPGSALTSKYMVDNHTLFPLYRPFMTLEKQSFVLSKMIDTSGDRKITFLHQSKGESENELRFMRFCPACIEKQENELGEAYWKRSHQALDVRVCHAHHNWLLESNVPLGSFKKDVEFVKLDANIIATGKPVGQGIVSQFDIDVADEIYWLLNEYKDDAINLNIIRDRYLSFLMDMGYATRLGAIKQSKIHDDIVKFYGTNFLATTGGGFDNNANLNWLSKLLRKNDASTHPVRHILLIHFLGMKCKNFLELPVSSNEPFGPSPWPCLNPAADHYKKDIVTKCSLTLNVHTRKLVGTFECQCGYIYSRQGPDKSEEDRCKIRRIEQFGPVWENELLRLRDRKHMTFDDIAVELLVSKSAAHKNYNRLSKQTTADIETAIDCKSEIKEEKRQAWTRHCSENDGKGRKELRQMNSKLYYWLYYHDCEWLLDNMPEKLPVTTRNSRKDWNKKDKELSDKVTIAADKIKNKQGRPSRISREAIIKLIDKSSIKMHFDKLPLTKNLIDSVSETMHQFHKRCVEYAITDLKNNNVKINVTNVMMNVHIKSKFRKDIEQILSENYPEILDK